MTSGPLNDTEVRMMPIIANTIQMSTSKNPYINVQALFSMHFFARQVTPQMPAKTARPENPISTPKEDVANLAT